jgi:hypothetical protein
MQESKSQVSDKIFRLWWLAEHSSLPSFNMMHLRESQRAFFIWLDTQHGLNLSLSLSISLKRKPHHVALIGTNNDNFYQSGYQNLLSYSRTLCIKCWLSIVGFFINWVIILEYFFKYLILSTNLALGQMMKINKFKMSYEFFKIKFLIIFHSFFI